MSSTTIPICHAEVRPGPFPTIDDECQFESNTRIGRLSTFRGPVYHFCDTKEGMHYGASKRVGSRIYSDVHDTGLED